MTDHEQIIEILKSTGRRPVEAKQVDGTWMLRAGIEVRFAADGVAMARHMAKTFDRQRQIRSA